MPSMRLFPHLVLSFRPIMSQSRLKILQSHLCCTASALRVAPASRFSSSKALKQNSSNSVTETISIVNSIVNTGDIRPAENNASFIMRNYSSFSDKDKAAFLTQLASDYHCQQSSLLRSLSSLSLGESAAVGYRQQQKLRENLTPAYELLFREIGASAGGVKFLVDLRHDLINLSRGAANSEKLASLQAMNYNLKELLSLWFGVGFLSLERITWKSPCDLLEKVAGYEGVHPVRNVSDLRLRVGAYRRCYTFIHPSMPREPVVILHVALTDGIASNIQAIVPHPTLSHQSDFKLTQHSEEDTSTFNSAVFYSITSTQPGLKGIDLGNYLIKSVVKQLQSEFPHLTQFSSLSPIPGFRDWLFTEINQQMGGTKQEPLLNDHQMQRISTVLQCQAEKKIILSKFKKLLQNGNWCKNTDVTSGIKDILMYLCARYLYLEKHRNYALNPVANFHLRNGATLWRINWLANSTAKGLSESCGLMVNYRYYLDKTLTNSQQYNAEHIIDVSPQVTDLLN